MKSLAWTMDLLKNMVYYLPNDMVMKGPERHVRCTSGDTPADEHRCEADSQVSRLL